MNSSLAEALEKVDAGVSDAWKAEADAAIEYHASLGLPFTSRTLWTDGLPLPREPRAIGPRLIAARKKGLIVATGLWREYEEPFGSADRHPPFLCREWEGV